MYPCAVLLLIVVGCSGLSLNDNLITFNDDNQYEEFLPHDYDGWLVDEDEKFEDEESEIDAIQKHVKYQDATREAMMEIGAKLRKGKNVTGAFLKVINGFEKGIADIQASIRGRRVDRAQISRTENFIREAAKNRKVNSNIIKSLAAEGIFLTQKSLEEGAVAKRSTADYLKLGAKGFLDIMRKEIGEEAFDETLGVSGWVTLMFTMDTTGSMGPDIDAAIALSKEIVNQTRDYEVDYILSPFNDPSTGPIITKKADEGEDFIKALEALRASGGGDCPEKALTGILNALDGGPQDGSPMYIFTDAGANDDTEEKRQEILDRAFEYDVRLNFFTRGKILCNADGIKPYEYLADQTNGLVYSFESTSELKRLGKLIESSLNNQGSVGGGSGGGAVAVTKKYPIRVDDSIESLSITVTSQHSGNTISLVDPAGNTVTDGRVQLLKGVVYNIEKPITGEYKLIVPPEAGTHTYNVVSESTTNIDFGYYYVLVARRGSRVPTPVNQPLEGLKAKVFITVTGVEYVVATSLRIKVADESDTILADEPLTPVGTSGVRFFVTFDPPSKPFRLQLHGLTVKGSKFARVSPSLDKTISVFMKLSYREDSDILRRGQKTSITVIIQRADADPDKEDYTLSLVDERGYGSVVNQPRPVRRARKGFAKIMFDVPADAPDGKLEKVTLSLTKTGGELAASLTFFLLLK